MDHAAADAQAVAFLREFRGAIHYAINLEAVPAHQRDDVWQEVSVRMVQLFRRGAISAAHPGRLSYVITLVRNLCRSHRQREARHRDHADAAQLQLASHARDAFAQVERLQAHERLHACVALLPPLQRLVMRHVLQGWSHAEIGQEHHLSPGHVKLIAHRARVRLRHMLTNPRLN